MTTGKVIATSKNEQNLVFDIKFSVAPHVALQKAVLSHRDMINEYYHWVAMHEEIYLEVDGKRVAKATYDYNVFSGRGNVESRPLGLC